MTVGQTTECRICPEGNGEYDVAKLARLSKGAHSMLEEWLPCSSPLKHVMTAIASSTYKTCKNAISQCCKSKVTIWMGKAL